MKDLISRVEDALENGIDDGTQFTYDIEDILEIFKLIEKYVDKNGYDILELGSEWLFDDDVGQVRALDLVGEILDYLEKFSEEV